MSRIIIADNPLNELSIARELLPAGLDTVIARHGTPEFQAALADGSVRLIDRKLSERTLRAAITRNGGEILGNDW